jgi:hypothetical protein
MTLPPLPESDTPDVYRFTPADLRAAVAAARDTIDDQRRTIESLMDGMPEDGTTPVIRRIAAMESEIEHLRKDAERYRWLRNNAQWLGWDQDFQPDEVDRAIDREMKPPGAAGEG